LILAEAYEAFLLDLDGVVYRGSEAVPGAPEALARLREAGRSVMFLTNNSARTPDQIVEKLHRLDVEATPEEVVTSAQALADLLASRDGDRTAYVIGEDGILEALGAAGIEVLEGRPDRTAYVVVGWDRGVTYDDLRTASVLVGRGAALVATNSDPSYPAEGGELWPGAGAILAAIETATGVRAEVAGKPHVPLFETALSRAGTRQAAVVGDRIETDVAGARAAGLDGILVWTGAAAPADLLDHDAIPDATIPTLEGLFGERPSPAIRPARPEDVPQVRDLLREAALDPAEAGHTEGVVVATDGDRVVATGAAEVEGEHGYVRSVAVPEQARGIGLGSLVTATVAREATTHGARRLFLVTETADRFFAALGFEPMDRRDLPPWIGDRSTACSETATAMVRRVAPDRHS
jgi:glycerol 3-phosphatase-2